MRDFLHSEIGNWHRIPNIPDNPELAVTAGRKLCEEILEPLNEAFGRVHVRSGFRCARLNAYGHSHNLKCAANPSNYAVHIWDHLDQAGCMGATACVVLPWFFDRNRRQADWKKLAWWIYDHLPFHQLTFFKAQTSFNIGWHEKPERSIYSYAPPRGWLLAPGQLPLSRNHRDQYRGFPEWTK